MGHRTSPDAELVYEPICQGDDGFGFGGEHWVSYEEVWQLALESGESVSASHDVNVDQAIPSLLAGPATGDETAESTIRWPKLFHAEIDISGLEAASDVEFCIEHVLDNRPQSWVRPYTESYDVDAKYTRQTTPAPELPAELVERLRDRAGDDER